MKKGFTLIELLAVIVILAVIALIATPIVLNIIEESKRNSILRSAESYLKAVEISILNKLTYNLQIMDDGYYILENGNICLETYNKETKVCSDNDGNSNNNELEVGISGQIPESGSVIAIENGQIVSVLKSNNTKKTELYIDSKKIIKNAKGEVAYPVCVLSRDSAKQGNEIGAKYDCEVKTGEIYKFYVLSNNADGTTNLIMDQNINSDGTPAGKLGIKKQENKIYNLVSWISKEDYNDAENYREYGNKDKGPITAIKFLYEATKSWTNINPVNYTYNDRIYQDIPQNNISIGYTSFVSTNGVAILKGLSGEEITIGNLNEPLRARLPIYSATYDENKKKIVGSENGDLSDLTEQNEFLYTNLDEKKSKPPYGYWTLSSYYDNYIPENYDGVWYADCTGEVVSSNAGTDGDIGIRPIIIVNL